MNNKIISFSAGVLIGVAGTVLATKALNSEKGKELVEKIKGKFKKENKENTKVEIFEADKA